MRRRRTRAPLSVGPRGRRRWSEVSRATNGAPSRDEGFTLVELLIVTAIIPMIIGALSAGLWAVLTMQSSVSGRLGDSGDAQVVNATFVEDVESATDLTTSSTAAQCGTGTQLLGLMLGGVTGTEYVSYNDVAVSGGKYSLTRNECDSGISSTPNSTTSVATDLVAPCPNGNTQCESPPSIYDGTSLVTSSYASGYVSAQGISGVNFSIYEANSSYTYVLSATPAAGPSTAAASLGAPSTGSTCGFALPGTGTYASTLCFVGFSNQIMNWAQGKGSTTGSTACPNSAPGTYVTSAVPGGYSMSFCLLITSPTQDVVASTFPTWGGAFLGNDINGTPFYTGVGCADSDQTTTLVGGQTEGTPSCIAPAIYQNGSGASDTVTASNIVVTAPGGNDATNYEVITADAETTDPSESITWNSTLPTSAPLTFSQVPDTSSSNEGDACNNWSPSSDAAGQAANNGLGLTGINTSQVKCTSTWQSSATLPRTGTVLLELSPSTDTNGITQPVTISAALKGSGLEGIAIGLLLP